MRSISWPRRFGGIQGMSPMLEAGCSALQATMTSTDSASASLRMNIVGQIGYPMQSDAQRSYPGEMHGRNLERLQQIVTIPTEELPATLSEYLGTTFRHPKLREEQRFVIEHYDELLDRFKSSVIPQCHTICEAGFNMNDHAFYLYLQGRMPTAVDAQILEQRMNQIKTEMLGQLLPDTVVRPYFGKDEEDGLDTDSLEVYTT